MIDAVGGAPVEAGAPPLPRELQVEVTGSCNLSCQMCLVAYRDRLGRSASMSLATFITLLDDLPDLERITLQGLGEPLLAPELTAMITEAVGRGISVGFNTNATRLTPDWSRRLIQAGLSWLHVSIDGSTPATFSAIRVGAQLDVVVANLRALVAARSDAGVAEPRIQLNTVVMRRNIAELEDLVRLAADIGVDRMWVQGLSHDFADVADDEGFLAIRRWTDRQRLPSGDDRLGRRLDRARLLAAELGLDLRLPPLDQDQDGGRRDDEPGCDWPWRSAYVAYDGAVQPCCMLMGRDRGRLGSVAEQPLSQLWSSPGYRQLRADLLGPDAPSICRGCSAYKRTF